MAIPLPLLGPSPGAGVAFVHLQREQMARHLARHIEGEVRFDAATRKLYSTDASNYQIEPLGVVLPKTVADVRTAVQVAAEMHIPLTSRGGGTSLSGQSIGAGVILDCSKYLNQILELDPTGLRACVQPGVVLDQLNRAAADHGLQFGPEVATHSRATLGGMLGNNSAGARSIVYGTTADHTLRLETVLADGSPLTVSSLAAGDWDRRVSQRDLEGQLYREVRRIVEANADEIRRRFPKIPRRVSGYNLEALLTHAPAANPGLIPLLVGSEGTLAVVTEAEVKLVPRPKARGLAVPHFDSLAAAMDAVAVCLEFHPSAVELLDRLLIELSAANLALRETMAFVEGKPAALLMVEFSGDDPAEVADRVKKLSRRLRGLAGVTAVLPALESTRRDALWSLRSAALPLLLGLYGDGKPTTFVEDTAVAPARLPEFVERFRDLLAKHDTTGAFYGHASVGCLHIRPILNLKLAADVARMRRITADVTDLVLEFGGCLSGEHGDGLARSEWNQKLYGPAVYEAFRQIKRCFDPNGILNPGRIVDAPAMTQNLRYSPEYHPADPATVFDYSNQGGFLRAVELCNGNGACRKLEGGAMCPSYRATRDERDSTRGRANALRFALAGERPLTELRSRWVFDILDLCLMCKACKSECPSNVDMAKLKAEFLNFYYRRRPRPLGHHLLAGIPLFNRLAAPVAPLVNWFQTNSLARWVLEQVAGIDRRRSLPLLHDDHFRGWFAGHSKQRDQADTKAPNRRVILLDDCFTTYNEPEIGKAAVRLLEAAGYTVELAGLSCCGRPLLSKGFLQPARELIASQAARLARRITDGTPILGLEPSCLLSLVDEWPDLVPSVDVRRIAAAAHVADGWLARQLATNSGSVSFIPDVRKCVVHTHCQQNALVGNKGTLTALRSVPGLDVTALDAGCCGMAGAFGFEREHYDLSVKIAGLALVPSLAKYPEAVVVATGTSCRHQIRDLTGRRALHPLELLAEQISAPAKP